MKYLSPGINDYLCGKGTGAGDYAVSFASGGTTLQVRVDGTSYTLTTGLVSGDGGWHRWVINLDRQDAEEAELYEDGVSVGTVDISAKNGVALDGTGHGLGLATYQSGSGGSNDLTGSLAYFQLRTALWTTDEIAEDYAFLSDLTLVTPTIGTTAVRP